MTPQKSQCHRTPTSPQHHVCLDVLTQVCVFYQVIGEADRSSARQGRVRVRARVVWFLLDTFTFN
jgi:hypothetical protein